MPEITGVIFESVAEMRGQFPTIPLAGDVDFDALIEGDDNPMFVSVPVGHVDSVSRNSRRYNRAAVEAIVDAVNNRRIVGELGHLPDDKRATEFKVSPLRWVGATIDEATGTAWAKAYVLKTAEDVREYIRIAKATNAQIGTSIYGTAEGIDDDGTVQGLSLESIDLVHPERVGNPQAAHVPYVTSEAHQPSVSVSSDVERDGDVSLGDTQPLIESEMEIAMPEETQIAELQRKHQLQIRELLEQINNYRNLEQDFQTIASELGLAEASDVVSEIRGINRQLADLRRENADLLQSAIRQAVAEAVQIESRRQFIVELVQAQNPATRADVQEALDGVLARDSIKAILRETVTAEMGPSVTVNPDTRNDNSQSFIYLPQ